MSLFKVFGIAGSGMSAQSVRLNLTASNLANSVYQEFSKAVSVILFLCASKSRYSTANGSVRASSRLGENARMVITGDLSQVDLPKGTHSGLRHALRILDGVAGIDFVHFSDADVVRHPLVARIVRAYDRAEGQFRAGTEYESEKVGTDEREA